MMDCVLHAMLFRNSSFGSFTILVLDLLQYLHLVRTHTMPFPRKKRSLSNLIDWYHVLGLLDMAISHLSGAYATYIKFNAIELKILDLIY